MRSTRPPPRRHPRQGGDHAPCRRAHQGGLPRFEDRRCRVSAAPAIVLSAQPSLCVISDTESAPDIQLLTLNNAHLQTWTLSSEP